MEIWTSRPNGILANYVKYFWGIETGIPTGIIRERIFPTGSIDLVFHYAHVLSVDTSSGESFQQAPMLISGQSSSFADVYTTEKIGMIAAVFYPQTASLFFKFPMNIIENQSVCLKMLLKNKTDILEEKINSSTNHKQRIAAIEQFLLNCLYETPQKETKLIEGAIKLINQQRGQINSTALADKLGVSKKQLERKFSSLVGKSPKQFIKLVRFHSVLDNSKNLNEEKLSTLAYDNGYFDQAHFINDFKSYTGYSPKEFFKVCNGCSDYFY